VSPEYRFRKARAQRERAKWRKQLQDQINSFVQIPYTPAEEYQIEPEVVLPSLLADDPLSEPKKKVKKLKGNYHFEYGELEDRKKGEKRFMVYAVWDNGGTMNWISVDSAEEAEDYVVFLNGEHSKASVKNEERGTDKYGFRRRCGWCGVVLRGWQLNLCSLCRPSATGSAGIYLSAGGPPCSAGSRLHAAPDRIVRGRVRSSFRMGK
jgi:hypothetical protein